MVDPRHEALFAEYEDMRALLREAHRQGDKKMFTMLVTGSTPLNATALLWSLMNQIDILERSTGE